MRKLSSLVALGLLAVAGTSHAITCTYDNVPAATLLVPYFRVSNNGVTNSNAAIPTRAGETDTLMAITNVSANGLIVHATVWNKYSAAVLDYNIPMTGYDVVYFSAKQILNGNLNANLPTIAFWRNAGQISKSLDPCAITPGLGQFRFVRFANPDVQDAGRSVSIYADPAYTGAFREKVWDSLDESGDISEFQDAAGGNFILDGDNPACGDSSDGKISGDFTGYITFDVANYCTNHFPDELTYYSNDAIATRGWPTNALIGDVFYIEYATSGNISGDQMIPLEFDAGLNWRQVKTFYSRYNNLGADPTNNAGWPAAYQFDGDGREALGERYGFRYFRVGNADGSANIQTWLLVFRSDRYDDGSNNLCGWYYGDAFGYETGSVSLVVYDEHENSFAPGGGPSGGPAGKDLYIFLETQRISLFNSASQWNPGNFSLGWMDLNLDGDGRSGHNQGWVGVQHSGSAAFLSVGHGAALLTQGSTCTSIAN